MKVDVTNNDRSRGGNWLILLALIVCFGGIAVSAQDIRKLEEINFVISRGGLLDPQMWHNPDTKLSKEAKVSIGQANMNVTAAIMKGRTQDRISGRYSGGLVSNFQEGRIRATYYEYDEIGTTAKKNVPGCHLSSEMVKDAMRRIGARLTPEQIHMASFTLHCLPKCTGIGCGPQNTVTLRVGADPNSQSLFIPRSEIWIRDTSADALKDSYAATISDPWEQKVALIVHMIGRIVHERNAGEFYYSLGGQKPDVFSRALSPLAVTSKRMFAAEVFTALVMRNEVKDIDGQIVKNFTPEIMTQYTHLRGPRWWQ